MRSPTVRMMDYHQILELPMTKKRIESEHLADDKLINATTNNTKNYRFAWVQVEEPLRMDPWVCTSDNDPGNC